MKVVTNGGFNLGSRIPICVAFEVEIDSAVANRTGEPGRAGADIADLSGTLLVFCGCRVLQAHMEGEFAMNN
jgi:hypothetical protein